MHTFRSCLLIISIEFGPKLGYALTDRFQMWVDLQSSLIALDRLGQLALMGVAMAHSRPRPEMARHALYGAQTIQYRFVVSLLKIMRDRPLVVGFGEGGVQLDCPREMVDGQVEIAMVQRFGAKAQFVIGVVGLAASEPDRPERMLCHFIDDRIGIAKQFRQRAQTALAPDEGKGESSHLSRILVVSGQQSLDLVDRPARLEQALQSVHVPAREQWLNRLYKMSRIHGMTCEH